MIKFQGFMPDAPAMTEGAITDCKNLIPTTKGFKSVKNLVSSGMSAVGGSVKGAALVMRLDNIARFFVGTGDKLLEQSNGQWVNRSRLSGYTVGGENRWRFAQFGNVTLATNQMDTIQHSIEGAFADIGGAPKARIIETVAGFVMAFAIVDNIEGDMPDMWWCSALYNHLDWKPNIATQSANGRLIDSPGEIRAAKKLGNNIVVYKEKSMYIGAYVGPPIIWQWQQIPGEIGAVSQESVVSIDTAHVFIGADDFWLFDGSRPVSIGAPVRHWFFNNLNPEFRHHTVGFYDRIEGIVYWYFVSKQSAGVIDTAIVYNVKTNAWGKVNRKIKATVEFMSPGVTYDTLGDIYPTWDALVEIPYDSPRWFTSGMTSAVFDTNDCLMLIDGKSEDSSLTTHIFGDDTLFTTLLRVTPRFIKYPETGRLLSSHARSTGMVMKDGKSASMKDGKFDLLQSARWHKVKVDFTGDMEIVGFDVELTQDGTR